MYLFFDTETSGLPVPGASPFLNPESFPHVLSIAWLIYDKKENLIKEKYEFIQHNNIVLSQKVKELTHITEEDLKSGKSSSKVISEFLSDLDKVKYIIGHNITFDINVILAQCIRDSISGYEDLVTKKQICTMRQTTDFCKLKSEYAPFKFKYPKLSELYYKLFEKEVTILHQAMEDTKLVKECFFELKKRGVIDV
jgi:DNA polymerase III alpha subunit (gram-positive type)